MKKIYLPLVLFIVLVLEGVALKLLPVSLTHGHVLIISHWVLICLIYTTMFYDTEETKLSLIYAFIFGFLIDIVYTDILGVYAFTYAITIYIIKKLTKLLQSNFLSTVLFGVCGVLLADIFIYLIFLAIDVTELTWQDYLVYRLLPTILANILFLMVIYPIMTNWFMKWKKHF